MANVCLSLPFIFFTNFTEFSKMTSVEDSSQIHPVNSKKFKVSDVETCISDVSAPVASASSLTDEENPKSRANRAAESNHDVIINTPFTEQELSTIKQELEKQTETVMTSYWVEKLEKESTRHWNTFYKRNTLNFFKNRYYIHREIPELEIVMEKYAKDLQHANETNQPAPKPIVLTEVGCGVGNAIVPLMEDFPLLNFQACDCAKSAVTLMATQPSFDASRCISDVCDIAKQPLPFAHGASDFATLIFVLSALSPETMPFCMREVRRCLNSDGILFIRDYALYDMTMLRFKKGSKVRERFYMRGDGTRTYFFDKEEMSKLLSQSGFIVNDEDVVYIRKTVENRKTKLEMKRTWIQVKCRVDPNWVDPGEVESVKDTTNVSSVINESST